MVNIFVWLFDKFKYAVFSLMCLQLLLSSFVSHYKSERTALHQLGMFYGVTSQFFAV